MKRTKHILIAIAALLFSFNVSAQLNIQGTRYSFDLNSDEWRFLRTFDLGNGETTYLYCYIGEVLLDEAGDTILPFLRIFVKQNYSDDLYQFIYERYESQPYQSLNEWTHGIGLPKSGGLGYEGIYTNPTERRDYRFMMSYFRDKRTVVEFRLETTRETYEEMEEVFRKVLTTIK